MTLGATVGVLFGLCWLALPSAAVAVTGWMLLALFLGIAGTLPPRWACAFSAAFGFVALWVAFQWVPEVVGFNFDVHWLIAHAFFAGMVGIDTVAWVLLGWAAAMALHQRRVSLWWVPAMVIATDFWWPRVFPWSIGHLLIGLRPFIQSAEIGGVAAVSGVMASVALLPALALQWLRNRQQRPGASGIPFRPWPSGSARDARVFAAAAVALALLSGGLGYWRENQLRASQQEEQALRVAAVQVDSHYAGAEERLRDLSLAITPPADLVVWPESCLGVYNEKLTHFADDDLVFDLAREPYCELPRYAREGSTLLACGKTFTDATPEEGPYKNTAFLIGAQHQILGTYVKRSLLPWGEYVPGQNWIPSLRHLANIDLIRQPGNDPSPLVTEDGLRVGVLICYDDIVARNARETVAAGAELLAVQVNASDYDDRRALRQHCLLAQLRSVENRRYFVRCSSTGISCVIAPWGEMVAQCEPQTEGVVLSTIYRRQDRTFYNRTGDWLPYGSTGFLLFGLVSLRRRRPAS